MDAGIKYGVPPHIHPMDFMAKWILQKHTTAEGIQSGIDAYFSNGAYCADQFRDVVLNVGFAAASKIKILEFAAGYGRVTRHLPVRFPNASIVAADIHYDAVRFVEEQIGVPAFHSASVPEQLDVVDRYDVIWALSFFSHMPPATFGRWIKALYGKLNKGGVLVFSTAGRALYGRDGRDPAKFRSDMTALFLGQSEQEDLSPSEYGSMFVMPGYVINEIYEFTRAPIRFYQEQFWTGGQDLFVITTP